MTPDPGLQLLVLLLAFPPVFWLATVAHELGHAVAAKLCGYHVVACGTGVGRVVLQFRVGETSYFVGLRQPANGVTFSLYPGLVIPRSRAAWHMAGGILANAAFAAAALIVALALRSGPASWVAYLAAALNGLMAATNLLPLSIDFGGHTVHSDGTQLYRILRRRVPERMLDAVNAQRGTDGLFREVGQDRMRAWFRYHAARVWAVVGSADRAAELLAAADELGPGPTAYERGMAAFCRAFVLDARKDRAGAAAAIAEARFLFVEAGDPDAQTLCDLIRVEILAESGDAAGAESLIAGWEAGPAVPGRLVPLADRVRVFARFLLGETAAADELARNVAADPDPVSSLAVLRQAGRVCRDRGDVARAERLLREACRALPRVAAGFGVPDDLATFQAVRSELVQEYRAAAAAAGAALDPDLPAWEASGPEQKQAATAEHVARDHRRLRWGVGLAAAQLAVVLGVAGVTWYLFVDGLPNPRSRDRAVFLVLTAYAICGALYVAIPAVYVPVQLLVRRVWPGAAPNLGRTALGMGVAAWLIPPAMTVFLVLSVPDAARRDTEVHLPDSWPAPEPDDEHE